MKDDIRQVHYNVGSDRPRTIEVLTLVVAPIFTPATTCFTNFNSWQCSSRCENYSKFTNKTLSLDTLIYNSNKMFYL